ncbi:MAG: SDR family NAD(P)-dependent oxidoreductase [Alphaproteobacteria bacterium]|nr:SDR family NAD(P)-dependent oxidoreductase [Alphaproteobacteria bacterium]
MTPKSAPLSGRIALVTGASRGAGRGIAIELGAAGASVIVTGRSTRARPAESYGQILGLSGLTVPPGTIEDTADAVTAAGGRGLPRLCDHRDPDAVESLVAAIEAEIGPIDVLVNNAWAGHESFDGRFAAPFWEQPLSHWEAMMDGGARLHLVTARAVAPRMAGRRRGAILATTFWDLDRFLRGNLSYDLAKAAINRLALAIAEDLRPHGVASLAVSPGWMRTEWVLAGHRTDEAHWQGVPALARTESPHYLGRAVAALSADPDILRQTGRILRVADLADHYGFTDTDGRRVPAFELE